jgi:hypothetical protein
LSAGIRPPPPPANVTFATAVQYPCRAAPPGESGRRVPGCSIAEQASGAATQGNPAAAIVRGGVVRRGRSGRGWSGVATACATATALAALSLALIGAAPAAAAEAGCDGLATPDVPSFEAVAPGVWRLPAARGDADAANRGITTQLVLVRDGARRWLIGSGPSPSVGAAIACAAQRVAGGAVTDVVNTRAAPELAMGNLAFAGARLWALPDVITAMRARCPQCQQRLKARLGDDAGASLRPETIRAPAWPVGARAQPGGRGAEGRKAGRGTAGLGAARGASGAHAGRLGPFEWIALDRARGERTLVLRLRRADLVIAQGLVWAGDVPDLRETDSTQLAAGLRRLRTFTAGHRLLGEQGDVADASAIDAHLRYLAALRDAVEPVLARGELPGSAAAAVELPWFAALPSYGAWHPLNVQHVWRELEPALFR